MGAAASHPTKCEEEGWQRHTLTIISDAIRVAATSSPALLKNGGRGVVE